jgi:uncharacterized membrane protein
MAWILIATAGQLLNALVAFLDKYIVTDEKALPRPFVYAFYSCLLTGFWGVIYLLGFIPGLSDFGMPSFSNVEAPTIQVVGMSFLAAYTFFMALVSMYDALRKAEAVNVMPIIGTISALATLLLSHYFLEVPFSLNFIWGVVVLSLGTMLVAQTLPSQKTLLNLVHSGVFFAFHYISMKALFMETSFDDGFFWSRMGFVLFALSLLMVPAYYEKIFDQSKKTTKKTGVLVLSTKVLAGISAFMILKATDWGDVAVVQALDGLKFVFILFITFAIGSLLPDSAVKTDPRPKQVVRTALYVAIIAVGYLILFL